MRQLGALLGNHPDLHPSESPRSPEELRAACYHQALVEGDEASRAHLYRFYRERALAHAAGALADAAAGGGPPAAEAAPSALSQRHAHLAEGVLHSDGAPPGPASGAHA